MNKVFWYKKLGSCDLWVRQWAMCEVNDTTRTNEERYICVALVCYVHFGKKLKIVDWNI